jgi:signal transduction histidine kinase
MPEARPRRTIRRKLMGVVIATTFIALAINAIGLIALEAGAYRASQLAAARSLADILARGASAAVTFNDRKEAAEALSLLRENPAVLAAGVYTASGELFAAYEPGELKVPPRRSGDAGLTYAGNRIEGFNPIVEEGTPVGAVYLSAYYGFYERMLQYAGVLAAVLFGALGAALVLSSALQRSLTRPIQEVTDAARQVVERQDYSVRAAHRADDETGVLADAFNHMLAEIDRRSKELRAADRRKDEFLATLAHELRNPLAPIRNAVSLLKRSASPDANTAWARDIIDRQAGHMARLLDDLLDVGRISRGKLDLRKERVSLASVIDAAVETSRPFIEAGRHALTVELPAGPAAIEGDAVRLSQIFANLLNNAAKYTDPGGRIELRARREEGRVVVTVSDTGIGMAPETVQDVFGIFSQATPALQRSQGGLGIGLYLVRSLAEMHGGSVAAASPGVGRGSQFSVTLPLAPDAAEGAAPPHASAGDSQAATLRVMVADDNRDGADSLAALFRMLGNEVRTAYDGLEAVQVAATYRPQLAVLDIGMPRLNGYDAARRIREQAQERKLVLVALTGWGQESDRRRAAEAGFDRHLTKPVTPEALLELLKLARAA